MPSPIEIAYDDLIRGLDGQATDLENIRSPCQHRLVGGRCCSGVPSGKVGLFEPRLYVAFAAFGLICLATAYLYKSVTAFTYDFVQDDLLAKFGDNPDDDNILRWLLEDGVTGYTDNRTRLERRPLACPQRSAVLVCH